MEVLQDRELLRRAAMWLHRRGLEVTMDEVAADLSYTYDAIRHLLRTEGRVVPKSDHDMRRWLASFYKI